MMRISVLAHKSRGEDQKEKGLRGEILDFVLVFTRVFSSWNETLLTLGGSSVRRIFERGAGNLENLRTTKTRIKIFPPVRFPAQNQVKTKKKSSLRFTPVFGPKLGKIQNEGLRPLFVCSNLLPKLQREGGRMPQFCILFHANYTILAT